MITTPLWWAFLLAAPVLYWLAPARYRAGLLAVLSFALLMYYAPWDIGFMGLLATGVFLAHNGGDRPGLLGAIGRLGRSPWPIAAVLIYFITTKYLPSIARALGQQGSIFDFVVPLGVSYFTFKLLHYTFERRRRTLPDHNYTDFASYMFLAPIFTAGPIERFDHYLAHRETTFNRDMLYEGLLRIAQGLVKKFVFAVVVLEFFGRITGGDFPDMIANLDTVSPLKIWLALFLALAFSYLDFSAYSDIAIGSSRLFGLRIAENFNMPFLALSLREFWQRWHMTLASWVLTYIYMPMVGTTRNPYWSIIISFGVVGIWHAAWPIHWVLWGLWHGVGLAILIWWQQLFRKRRSKFLQKRPVKFAGWAITMFYVAASEAFPSLYGTAPVTDSFRLLLAGLGLPV